MINNLIWNDIPSIFDDDVDCMLLVLPLRTLNCPFTCELVVSLFCWFGVFIDSYVSSGLGEWLEEFPESTSAIPWVECSHELVKLLSSSLQLVISWASVLANKDYKIN